MQGENQIEIIQELLDEGYSKNKVAEILGLHHKTIGRLVSKYSIEIYTPFNEVEDERHMYQNFEWLWEEDKLDDILREVVRNGEYSFSRIRNEDDFRLSKYCKQTYGDLFNYIRVKDFTFITDSIFITCCNCGREKSLEDYSPNPGNFLGVDGRCKSCIKKFKQVWQKNNREKTSAAAQRRRARKVSLPYDLTEEEIDIILSRFNGCVLTGDISFHLDHVIPLAIGHGGTTFGNISPLRSDLNMSKSDRNIFEWFDSVRQRFELSQENFDTLIEWLASVNEMTVEEYRDYVYWCHENPRSIDENKTEGGTAP
jgi:hypothetical protein